MSKERRYRQSEGPLGNSGQISGPPRQPTQETLTRLLNGSGRRDLNQNNNSSNRPTLEAIASRSSLSAAAPEFVPKSIVSAPQATLSQANTVLSATAPEFVPRNFQTFPNSQTMPTNTQASSPSVSLSYPVQFMQKKDGDESGDRQPQPLVDDFQHMSLVEEYCPPVVLEFMDTLSVLTTQPGNIEEYLRPLCKDLKRHVDDESILEQIIDILYEQCVTVSNFRYTGARVCQHLSKELRDHRIFCHFRGNFLSRCEVDFNRRDQLVSNKETESRICGLTLFLGELFLNMEVEGQDGRPRKIDILPQKLIAMLFTLLRHKSDDTVKCATQLLKLAGAAILDAVRGKPDQQHDYEEIFMQLQTLYTVPFLGDTSKRLIQSVLNLRETNWGRTTSTSSETEPSNVAAAMPQFYRNDPVFYNALGQTISRKEAGLSDDEDEDVNDYLLEEVEQDYLQWQAEENSNGAFMPNYNPRYTAWSNPEEPGYQDHYAYDEGVMGEEEEAAYEEFLREQQSIHNKKH